ncbi:hypothetical protein [Paraburkholderia sp. J94]|uniref:hypothetical protein n=1 Tax=Paraburkholderia sp. J94 TaxID=2805441 RepID=UPI002AB15BD7|nr:hypothetical protein [Paraburkholderia sp. J94]
MKSTTRTLFASAAAAALMISGAAFAQNNTLATPSVKSPVAPPASGYGTPGLANSDSGARTQNSTQANGTNTTSIAPAYGTNNTLATPSTKSPAGQ